MKTRKIAFLGTSCVGKTTIAQSYKRRTDLLFDLQVVDEVARAYFESHKYIDHFTFNTQKKIQDLVVQTEIEYIKKFSPDVLLCDSTVVNPVLWTRVAGDALGAERLLQNVSWWIPTYDVTFVFDPQDVEFIQDDIVRVEDRDMRMRVHELLLDLLENQGITYFTISGTVTDRISKIDELLHVL